MQGIPSANVINLVVITIDMAVWELVLLTSDSTSESLSCAKTFLTPGETMPQDDLGKS